MAETKPALHLSLQQARAGCIAAQGLNEGSTATLSTALERHGFVRTLGGVEAYLALLCRVPGLERTAVDAAVQSGEIKVVPAARGCMYLVASSQVPLALRAADALSRGGREREQAKAGIQPGELEPLGKAILVTLAARGPLTTDALRKAVPAGAVRSLGEAGKKVGISSTLPPALRRLELDSAVERVPAEGRLDNERYHWRIPSRSQLAAGPTPQGAHEAFSRLAELFFRAACVSTMADFAAWAGLAQRDAKAALANAALLPVTVEGIQGIAYAPLELRSALERPAEPPGAAALLPFEDNLVALHGGPALFVDAAYQGLEVPQWGSQGRSAPLATARHVEMRCLLAGDRVAGLWDYDPDEQRAVWTCFEKPAAGLRKKIEAAAERIGRFLQADIGHGRSFSLDTDADLRERVAFVSGLHGN